MNTKKMGNRKCVNGYGVAEPGVGATLAVAQNTQFSGLGQRQALPLLDKRGNLVPDKELTDTEQVPLDYPGGIDAFITAEVLPYAPDAWVDNTKTQIGYEISFTKHFYKPVQLRELSEIVADIRALEKETEGLLEEVLRI